MRTGRPRLNADERRAPIAITLAPASIVRLDAIVAALGSARGRVMDDLIAKAPIPKTRKPKVRT